MKKVLFILALLLLVNCGEIQHCEYTIKIEHLNDKVDTVRVNAFTQNQDLKLINNQLRFGNNFIFRDSVRDYDVLKKTCFQQITIPPTDTTTVK